jgi:hypothetical protein
MLCGYSTHTLRLISWETRDQLTIVMCRRHKGVCTCLHSSLLFLGRLKEADMDFLAFNASLFKAVMRASPVSELYVQTTALSCSH